MLKFYLVVSTVVSIIHLEMLKLQVISSPFLPTQFFQSHSVLFFSLSREKEQGGLEFYFAQERSNI